MESYVATIFYKEEASMAQFIRDTFVEMCSGSAAWNPCSNDLIQRGSVYGAKSVL
jgi:hypothetical protein